MLKVLKVLEKVASSLDSKKAYDLADESDKISAEIMSKKAQDWNPDISVDDAVGIPVSIAGDPFEYRYLPSANVYEVVRYRGKDPAGQRAVGRKITQTNPVAWQKLEAARKGKPQPNLDFSRPDDSKEMRASQPKVYSIIIQKVKDFAVTLSGGFYGESMANIGRGLIQILGWGLKGDTLLYEIKLYLSRNFAKELQNPDVQNKKAVIEMYNEVARYLKNGGSDLSESDIRPDLETDIYGESVSSADDGKSEQKEDMQKKEAALKKTAKENQELLKSIFVIKSKKNPFGR